MNLHESTRAKRRAILDGICLEHGTKPFARFEEAVAEFERLGAARPERFEPLFRLGNLLRGKERFEEAVAAYDRALERVTSPERRHWTMFYFRGIALERLNPQLRTFRPRFAVPG